MYLRPEDEFLQVSSPWLAMSPPQLYVSTPLEILFSLRNGPPSFLQKHSSWSLTFPVEGRVVGKDDLQPLRMVMLVEAARIPDVRRELDKTVGNMAAAAAAGNQ